MKGTQRVCENGHRYYKSSDCPTCPACESEKKPVNGFLTGLAAPARRALHSRGIDSLEKLAAFSERELLTLHGIGPSSLPKLRTALKNAGLSFRNG